MKAFIINRTQVSYENKLPSITSPKWTQFFLTTNIPNQKLSAFGFSEGSTNLMQIITKIKTFQFNKIYNLRKKK